ncbi:MAG: YceH family protein [Gaiellaceae bacterium]
MDLDTTEIRVLGCLIEKQRTTPEQYPLSLNSLRLACNQATNRDPVTDYDEAEIRAAIDMLSRRGWVRLASGPGGRVAKYRHLLDDALGRVPSQIALLAVLMLRGAQTPGELKQRVERLYPYPTLDDVQKALDALAAAELVERLQRRPGQSQDRWIQRLGDPGLGKPDAEDEPQRSTNVESVVSTQSPLEARVARLEEQVAALQQTLAER